VSITYIFNSTIFTTNNNEIAILGKTLSETREKLIAFFEAFERGGIKGQDGIIDTFFSKDKKSPLTPELLSDFENFKEEFNNTSLSAEVLKEEFGEIDQRIIDYAKTCKNGEMTTKGFKASIDSMSFSAKAGQVALKALFIAGNMFAMWAITKGIELAVKGIDNLIHASEKEKEKLKEIRQKTHEAVEAYKQEQADLDSTIEKYKDLNEQLTSASLTTEEYNSIKEQLSSIQDDLVSKYGEEASAIDVVNGKYDEQIKKLDAISRKKAQDFVNENASNIQEDLNFLNDSVNIYKHRSFSGNKYLNAGESRNITKNIHYTNNPEEAYSTLEYDYNGTPEEIRKQINAEINALREYYGNSNEDVNVVINDLSELLKSDEISSEQINQSHQNLLENAKIFVKSNSETQSAYDALIDGIEKYNNALETGEGVDKAYSNYEMLREEFENVSTDILGIENLYDELLNKLNEPLSLSFKLDKNIENGRQSTQQYLDKLQGVTSDQLRSFDYDDLLSVNSLNNYEDAFGHLVKQLGVSETGVDALIDRLIELGYVTDSVDIQNKENILNALGFDKNASNGNAAKRNITANNVYKSLTDEGIYYWDEALKKIKINYLYIENNPTRML